MRGSGPTPGLCMRGSCRPPGLAADLGLPVDQRLTSGGSYMWLGLFKSGVYVGRVLVCPGFAQLPAAVRPHPALLGRWGSSVWPE